MSEQHLPRLPYEIWEHVRYLHDMGDLYPHVSKWNEGVLEGHYMILQKDAIVRVLSPHADTIIDTVCKQGTWARMRRELAKVKERAQREGFHVEFMEYSTKRLIHMWIRKRDRSTTLSIHNERLSEKMQDLPRPHWFALLRTSPWNGTFSFRRTSAEKCWSGILTLPNADPIDIQEKAPYVLRHLRAFRTKAQESGVVGVNVQIDDVCDITFQIKPLSHPRARAG